MRATFQLLALVAALGLTANAWAAEQTFTLNMDGAQEAPGPGDPDGTATGTLSVNDSTGLISWDFEYFNITTPTLMHIHKAPFGVPGGVFIGMGVGTSGGAGTLIDSVIHAPLSQVSEILGDPAGFYVNIHNTNFPGGAVRGQLPEPSSLALLGVGALLFRRRRTA